MATTWSTNLGIALIGTGEQAGTWGATTNTNLGTLVEQAISGYATQAITDGADTTITIPNGATGVARNMYLELTGSLSAARNLIVPANKKLYFVYNNTTGGYAVTVKVSGQTGISVSNGKKMVLVCNGTDVFVATNHLVGTVTGNITGDVTGNVSGTAANVTGTVAVANGGTGATTAATARAALLPSYTANALKVLRLNSGATDTEWATIASGADVQGPASSTDNAITRFDGTTGKIIQSSTATLSDAGLLTATTFSGSGASLTNLNASNLSTGTVSVSLIPSSVAKYADATANFTGTLQYGGLEVGYRKVPRIAWTGGTATTAVVGKIYGMTAGGITVPASVFAEGDAFSLFNDSGAAMTITRGSGLTLYLNGTDKNVTINAHCMATIWFNSGTVAVISGSGLS